jgi:hypothetical protein
MAICVIRYKKPPLHLNTDACKEPADDLDVLDGPGQLQMQEQKQKPCM